MSIIQKSDFWTEPAAEFGHAYGSHVRRVIGAPTRINISCIQQFFMEHFMNIVSIARTFAAIIAALASIKALRPKAKPSVEDAKVTLPLFHPNTHYCSGQFLIRNSGPKVCSITHISLKSIIALPKIYRAYINQHPCDDAGGKAAQILPVPVEGFTPKQIFFRTAEIESLHREEAKRNGLPNSVILEVGFDCRSKPISKILYREADTPQYS